MIWATRFPSITTTPLTEVAPLYQEFRQAGDSLGDPPRLIRSQVAVSERQFLQVVAEVHQGQPKAVGIPDLIGGGNRRFGSLDSMRTE